jgi:hypothetical protein
VSIGVYKLHVIWEESVYTGKLRGVQLLAKSRLERSEWIEALLKAVAAIKKDPYKYEILLKEANNKQVAIDNSKKPNKDDS